MRETARFESARRERVNVKPSNPEDMDKLGLRVVLALKVISCTVGLDVKDADYARVEVRMFASPGASIMMLGCVRGLMES